MNVQANVEYIKNISQDIQDISRQLGRVSSELEDVQRELRKQTEFRAQIRELKKTEDKIEEEKYKTSALAQVLANIGNLYQKTETGIEEIFESKGPKQGRLDTAKMDLSGLYNKVNRLLYGGENGWRS